ncbi:hypothetical protein ACHAWX_006065 [Stephanocyclus meneghinianus]
MERIAIKKTSTRQQDPTNRHIIASNPVDVRIEKLTSMRNPVNRIATAAPRALESLFKGNSGGDKKAKQEDSLKTRAVSFDLDLSALPENGVGEQGRTEGGSTSSVVTFEELMSDMMMEEMASVVDVTQTGSKEWQ